MAGRLILIVEDNPRNLKLVRDVLTFAGYRTLEAENAEDALKLAREYSPDLILMDVQLPGMNGDEALRRLRDIPAARATPVVALTAFAMKDDRDRLLAAGFQGYLVKPISVRDFPGQVEQLLGTSATEAGR